MGAAFSSLPDECSLGSMTAVDLTAWENPDMPNIDRATDDSEARADEKSAAHCRFRRDMVVEGMIWFEFQGSPLAAGRVCRCEIHAAPNPDPSAAWQVQGAADQGHQIGNVG
jgi:hypothetical protein